MKRLLAMLALVAFSFSAQAAELPACDSQEVRNLLFKSTRDGKPHIHEIKDYMRSTDGKRWCYVFFTLFRGVRSNPYMEAIFTLEWVDERDGRYWLAVQKQALTCRGTNSGPFDDSRCPPPSRADQPAPPAPPVTPRYDYPPIIDPLNPPKRVPPRTDEE